MSQPSVGVTSSYAPRPRLPATSGFSHDINDQRAPAFPTALVRIALLIRTIRTTAWDDNTWPTVKVALARALDMRRQINREGWWN